MVDRSQVVLYHGGHRGTEAEFGRQAERWGVREVTLSFEGHVMERDRGTRQLTEEELREGDVSMEIVSRHMGRTYHRADRIRRVIQSIFHTVVPAYHVFAVGWIQADGTVKGGTGWGVELAKFFNRSVSVFDQGRNEWFTWAEGHWTPDTPVIPDQPIAATGTRELSDGGRQAIEELFTRSFGPSA
ncbi:MAG TPA: hypothetical protein VGV61_19245 [Thermoanaerobaculia bacterium]|jgi:hypothetical protein|nr:hypothetical protein [Thermoanaerobaculia bacterium]